MLEIVMAMAGVVLMARVARFEDRSALLWGGLTLGLCFLSLFLPWPLLRVLLAIVLAFGAMMGAKIWQREL